MDKLSEKYFEEVLRRLRDTIAMSQNSLTPRIEDSLEALDEVRAMATSAAP